MNSVDQILADYDARALHYRALSRKIRASLQKNCEKDNIPIHAIEYRIKNRDSLNFKLNRPDATYTKLDDLTDVAGVRVITYYASDVDRVAEIVQREYCIDEGNSIDKGALLDPDRFGYISLHYVVSLKENQRRSSGKKPLAGLKAEIQIRSILQHAWAEIEHDLGYKSRYSVPRNTRRAFSRLSGLLELADKEFDGILQSLRDYENEIVVAPGSEIAIDRLSLAYFIKNNELARLLDDRIRKKADLELVFEDWFVESLVDKLHFVDIANVSSLESELKRLSSSTEMMALDHLEGRFYTRIHQGVGIYYFCSTLLAESSDVRRIHEYLEKFAVGNPDSRQRIAQSIVEKYASVAKKGASAAAIPGP